MTKTKSTTKYSITAAHRITGKSRSTLERHLKEGKISCTRDVNGKRLIDASELIRAYGEDFDFSSGGKAVQKSKTHEAENRESIQLRLESVQQQLDTLQEERRREREQFQAQIDHLQETLRLAQEGHNHATRLLEHHTTTKQEASFEQRVGELKATAKREAIEELKNKPWWQLVFSN